MDDLIQKLMVSKKIMDKHKEIPRSGAAGMDPNFNESRVSESRTITTPQLEEFDVPQANYNIPQEFMMEQQVVPKPVSPTLPTKDRIMTSKLPDDIKKLMLEHPIQPAQMPVTTLSNELVEKAARLMGTTPKQTIQEVKKTQQIPKQQPSFDADTLKEMMRETIEEVLKENGLLVETTTKMNETIQFKVGKTIFEGKITKVKKIK